MREHVRALASREYTKAVSEAPDFVVMFVPGESFFAAAIESDPDLLEKAWRDKVLISTPTTLIALVKMIAFGWQQERLGRERAGSRGAGARPLRPDRDLRAAFMGDLGKSLRQTVERYNKGIGSLESRILPAARKFETLGVTSDSSSIPPPEPVELEPRALQAEELIESRTDEAADQ